MLATLTACRGGDGGGDGDGSTSAASGFADQDGGPGGATSQDGSGSGDGTSWGGTAYDGELRGVMTFVYSAPTSSGVEARVGLAGGYRMVDPGFDGIEDMYSPLAYQLAFPPLPAAADTTVADGTVPVFDWGAESDWLLAGNGMKVRQGEGGPEVLACLATYFPTLENPAGYPLYVSNATQDDACQATADAFAPATAYDVVLYGGDLFVDNVLLQRITTPPAVEITAPAFAVFDAPISSGSDLAFAWNASDDPESRVQIRIIDGDNNLVTAHATDDGSYSIPAADLQTLAPGPVDIMFARERTDQVQFTDGGVTVTSRWEQWGFFDLS
jgi:hypothetical protein